MFDFNPFREYKEMMKQRRLQEADHNMGMGAGARADYDSAEEHEKFVKEISDNLLSHGTSEEHLKYLKSNPNVHSSLEPGHIEGILGIIEDERHAAKQKPGSPFTPVHGELIGMLASHPNATLKHKNMMAEMEHGEGM